MFEPPPINPDVNNMADRVKHGFAVVTQQLAAIQYRLAELAATGQLAPDVSMSLQCGLVDVWEKMYFDTLCAVRDEDTDDWAWDEAENTDDWT